MHGQHYILLVPRRLRTKRNIHIIISLFQARKPGKLWTNVNGEFEKTRKNGLIYQKCTKASKRKVYYIESDQRSFLLHPATDTSKGRKRVPKEYEEKWKKNNVKGNYSVCKKKVLKPFLGDFWAKNDRGGICDHCALNGSHAGMSPMIIHWATFMTVCLVTVEVNSQLERSDIYQGKSQSDINLGRSGYR